MSSKTDTNSKGSKAVHLMRFLFDRHLAVSYVAFDLSLSVPYFCF